MDTSKKIIAFWNNYSSVGDWEGQDVQANIINDENPFMDVEAHDFRPADNSFLIDQGVAIDGITDGYLGVAPDIGAYEKGGAFWRPGVESINVITSIDQKIFKKQPLEVRVFPNPVKKIAHVLVELPQSSWIQWQLYTSDQKLIRQAKTAKIHEWCPSIPDQRQ